MLSPGIRINVGSRAFISLKNTVWRLYWEVTREISGAGQRDRLRCRGLYFLKNMGVNVCCSEYLRVTLCGRTRLNIHAVCNQQRGIQILKAVQHRFRTPYPGTLTESSEHL